MRTTVIKFAVSGLFLTLLLSVKASACTTAIVSAEASATGRPLIWKQRDADNVRNTLAHVKGERYSYTGIYADTDTRHSKTYGGINEVGFAIANNLSYNLRPHDTGTQNGLLMSRALGICESLEDFENMLREGTGLAISANFAVIDAHGGAAYFETWDHGYTRYDVPEGGVLYRTNFSLSGRENEGGGYARYEAISQIMEKRPRGGYSPEFFLDAARNFRHGFSGRDALKGNTLVYDNHLIPRPWSASSVIIEGVTQTQRPDAGMMWFVPGYPPCSYAVAVWVAAGDNLPATVSGDAPANALAVALMHKVHPFFQNEEGAEYLDVKAVKKILPIVRKAEKKELEAGAALDLRFRKNGFSPEAVTEYNKEAQKRFESFKNKVKTP